MLVLVREGGDRRAGGGDGALGGQYRDVLVRRAPRSAEVGQAEAVDLRVGVGVAPAGLHCVRAGVRAPLHHAEGDVGSGELAHGARADGSRPRSVERMDAGPPGRCRRSLAVGIPKRARKGRQRPPWSGRRARRAPTRRPSGAAPSAATDRAGHLDDRSNGDCGGRLGRIEGRRRVREHPRPCHSPLPCSASWVHGRPARCWGSISRRRASTASTTSRCPTRWCSVVEGVVVRSWSGLIDPGRDIPAGGDRGARHLDGAGPRRGHAARRGDRPRDPMRWWLGRPAGRARWSG